MVDGPGSSGAIRSLLSSAAFVVRHPGFLVALVVGSLLLRPFVIEAFKVPSGSMFPTIHVGDHVFASKSAYGFGKKRVPKRGDVVVFSEPETRGDEPSQAIKRVVGLPGDIVTVDGGHPSINGVPVPHCKVGEVSVRVGGADEVADRGTLFVEFLDGEPHLAFYEEGYLTREQGPYVVARNEVFVLGDNRHNALDSREWFGGRGGGVPLENLVGRGTMVWLPFARFGKSLSGATLGDDAPPELRRALEGCLRGG